MTDRPHEIAYSTDHSLSRQRTQNRTLVPLPVAVLVAAEVDRAYTEVSGPGTVYLGCPDAPAFPDEVVDEVCFALQHQIDVEGRRRTAAGAFCGEHNRHHTDWQHLDRLSPGRRRALVENLWAIRRDAALPPLPLFWKDDPTPAAVASSDTYLAYYGYEGE